MATTSTAISVSPSDEVDDGDWLGYGAYADSLWSRVLRALNKDVSGKPLGDDPLVVGIFGEWGAGKSHLLKLMMRRAEAQSKKDIALRVLLATDSATVALVVTVPVLFQPWKYEHEPHLHVPLAVHVADALEEAWKKLPADFEHVKALVDQAAEQIKATEANIKAASKVFGKMRDLWQGAQQVIHSEAAKVVAGTLDVAAISVGIPPVLTLGLDKAREHVGAGDDHDSKSAKPRATADPDKPAVAKKTSAEQRESSFSHSDNGLAFYRIDKLMQAMTRPKLDAKLLANAGLTIGKGIEFDLRVNFVVFVDDLDRCLPEKAVETLELIKTTFNIESFAFVLALDDEVIERGIGHRYKDYQLQGKKPEMPITGFEYLEKIVHVPFRLPALTKAQAAEFVQKYEAEIEANPQTRWFAPIAPGQSTADGEGKIKGFVSSGAAIVQMGASSRSNTREIALIDLALSGFDAFVPRKLIRMVELLHQVAAIAVLRTTPLVRGSGGDVDIRVVLALLLIQLFQPELFRIVRRRQESFPALLRAFAKPAETSAAIEPELLDAKVSDIDLWRWAVKPKVGSPSISPGTDPSPEIVWNPAPQESLATHAARRIAEEHVNDPAARTTAQHVRLPMVVQMIEHRSAQRHVFDVLKLLQALATAMEGSSPGPHQLVFAPYQSLLAKPGLRQAPEFQTKGSRLREEEKRLRFSLRNVKELLGDLVSEDTSAQANMASRHEFKEGHVLDEASVSELSGMLLSIPSDKATQLRVLNGLQFLAPFVSAVNGRAFWIVVEKSIEFETEPNPKLRALWGDVRSALGCDDRFDLPDRPYLMRERFKGHTAAEEPIPGFVRIPAGKFAMGSKAEKDNPPLQTEIKSAYYMQRTLVTVDQYRLFVEGAGYIAESWWDQQGLAWRQGTFDSKVENKDYQEWLARRSVDLRLQPMDWDVQQAVGSRPVHGISWFEARAYTRWLNARMRSHIVESSLDAAYQVMLPTELQWERAARASSFDVADQRIWPWGDDDEAAPSQANLNKTIGSVCAVGLYPPNPIGLYDLAGNAWEWMDNLYAAKAIDFPRVGKNRDLMSAEELGKSDLPTVRGGSWFDDPDFARCSFRFRFPPGNWDDKLGFRVVLSLAD